MSVRQLSTSACKLLAIIAGGLLYGVAQATTLPLSNGQIISAESVDAGDYYLGLNGQPIRFHRKKDVYLKLDSIATARKLKRDQFQAEKAGNNIAQAARAFVAAPAGFSQVVNHRWNGLEIVKRNPGLQSMAARASAALDNRETEYAPVFTSESGRGEYLILPDIMISFNSEADVQQYQQAMLEQFGMRIKNQMMFSETDFVLAFETGVDDYSTVFNTTRELMALPYIKWAEPNMQVKLQRTDTPNPNDYLYREQWGLENWGDDGTLCDADIDANHAWDFMDSLSLPPYPNYNDVPIAGGKPVIAIIDDGVRLTHPDLPIWTNPAPSTGIPGGSGNSGASATTNLCLNDFNGCNFAIYDESSLLGPRVYNVGDANDSGTTIPPNPINPADTHGTQVAGIAAAKRNNNIGIAGSAYNAEILPIRLDFYGATTDCIALYDALAYAAKYADIISNSWRLDAGDQYLNYDDPYGNVPISCKNLLDRQLDLITSGSAEPGGITIPNTVFKRGNKRTPVLFPSGNSAAGWRKITVKDLTAGQHQIRIAFHKDLFPTNPFPGDEGEDAVWIDNLTLPENSTFTQTYFDFDNGLPTGMSISGATNSIVTQSGYTTDYDVCNGSGDRGKVVDHTSNEEHVYGGTGKAIKLSALLNIANSPNDIQNKCVYLDIPVTLTTSGDVTFWAWISTEPWITNAHTINNNGTPQDLTDDLIVNELKGDPFRVYIDGVNSTVNLISAREDGVDKSHDSLNERYIYHRSIEYPASHPGVIAVGASNDGSSAQLEDRAYFSQYADNLDIVAPGIAIRSTTSSGGYGYLSGSSASVPLVAGIVANMLTIDPNISLADIKLHLRSSADQIGPQAGQGVDNNNEFSYDINGFNSYYGYGRANSYKASRLVADTKGLAYDSNEFPQEPPELCTDPNPGAADDDWLLLTMPAILAAALKNQ